MKIFAVNSKCMRGRWLYQIILGIRGVKRKHTGHPSGFTPQFQHSPGLNFLQEKLKSGFSTYNWSFLIYQFGSFFNSLQAKQNIHAGQYFFYLDSEQYLASCVSVSIYLKEIHSFKKPHWTAGAGPGSILGPGDPEMAAETQYLPSRKRAERGGRRGTTRSQPFAVLLNPVLRACFGGPAAKTPCSNAGGSGLTPDQGTRPHRPQPRVWMLQLRSKIPHVLQLRPGTDKEINIFKIKINPVLLDPGCNVMHFGLGGSGAYGSICRSLGLNRKQEEKCPQKTTKVWLQCWLSDWSPGEGLGRWPTRQTGAKSVTGRVQN